MDDLTYWQLEEAARRAHEALAEGSGALGSARMAAQLIESSGLTTQQMAAARSAILNAVMAYPDAEAMLAKVWANALPETRLDQFVADMARAAEIFKGIEALAVGVSLHVQATYAQMVTGLVELQRQFAGSGASFELSWEEGSAADDAIQELHLVVPTAGTLILGGEVTAQVIKGEASATLDDVTVSARGQVTVHETLHLGIGLGVVTVDSSLASLANNETSPNWEIERLEDATGTFALHFRAKGHEAISKLNQVYTVAKAIMSGETTDLRLLAAKTESDHWAYATSEKRAAIVEHYRRERDAGKVSNKEAWARSSYQISAKTLKRYEDEYDRRPDT